MILKIAYLITVLLAIALEHLVFSRIWKAYELARWTMGVTTVMGLALPLVLVGEIAFETWLLLLFAFGVAGATTTGFYIHEFATARQNRASSLRSAINEQTSEVAQQ